VARPAEADDLPSVVLKPGMKVEEYLQAAGYDAESLGKSGDWIYDVVPKFDEITAGWIFFYFLGPAFIVFVISVLTTPLQDKYLFGEEYEVDWTGKSGRLYKLFFGGVDPLSIPEAKSEMEFGDLRELQKMRDEEDGLLADVMRAARKDVVTSNNEEAEPADAPPASKPKLY